MTDKELSPIWYRAAEAKNVAIPEGGTSKDRVGNVANYLEAFASTYLPANENLMWDRDALVDVLIKLDRAEKDREVLLDEVRWLRKQLVAATGMVPTNGLLDREQVTALIQAQAGKL